MAFGFLKKIFSFGKKEVEEVPAPETPQEALPAPEAVVEAAPIIEVPVEEVSAVEPVALEGKAPEPVAETIVAPTPKPAPTPPAPKAKPAKPAKPAKAAPVVEENSFAPDGVYQPTPETADHDFLTIETPEPLDESSEPQPGNPQPLPSQESQSPAIEEPTAEVSGSDGAFAGEAELTPEPVAQEPVTPEPLASAAAARVPVNTSEGKVYIGKVEDTPPPPEPEEKLSWFQRLKRGLSRSSKELSSSITGIFTKRKLDEDTLQELEDVLIRADLGMETAIRITDTLSAGRYGKDVSDEEVRGVMRAEIEKVLGPVAKPLELDLSHKPHVILVVGVNGTGKTTTIGKLAAKLRDANLKVWLAAGDTFRAAAIEQLHIWGQRTGSPVVSNKIGADAAGLAYDAFEKAKADGADVLIIDTAGRLQNRTELMDELAKIVRVLGKLDPEAPHTVLQTLDATTGQNALSQVEIFRNVAGVNGLVMTKLDGTARGGILVAIAAKHKLPVYFVGVGEQVADLEPFSATEFAAAIAGSEQ
jgi:fused signal recognition particle receptor